jgi:transposase
MRLSGRARREYQAGIAKLLGRGGKAFLERHLNWNRQTIRKGERELTDESSAPDRHFDKGRRKTVDLLPGLKAHLISIMDPVSQVDPTFRTSKKYRPLTAAEVRKYLIDDKTYTDCQLPTVRTFRTLLNELGYHPQRVAKSKPLKKIEETDRIFERVHQINAQADADPDSLRLSMDCKAVLKIGEFSRGGRSRQAQKALDHDFEPSTKMTPFGIFLPQYSQSFLSFTEGSATADFMIDSLVRIWPRILKEHAPKRLVINLDNGPENSTSRTQWISRLVDFSIANKIEIQLAYYPPYHSKYNPVERLWGILENHWSGQIIDSVQKALGLARTMTYNSIEPAVFKLTKRYKKGISKSKEYMKKLQPHLSKTEGLEKWFITISPEPKNG